MTLAKRIWLNVPIPPSTSNPEPVRLISTSVRAILVGTPCRSTSGFRGHPSLGDLVGCSEQLLMLRIQTFRAGPALRHAEEGNRAGKRPVGGIEQLERPVSDGVGRVGDIPATIDHAGGPNLSPRPGRRPCDEALRQHPRSPRHGSGTRGRARERHSDRAQTRPPRQKRPRDPGHRRLTRRTRRQALP